MPKLTGHPAFQIAVIFFLGLLIYSNTFHVPFQWDDDFNIIDNPFVKDLSYFAEPDRAEILVAKEPSRDKYLSYYYSFRDRYIGICLLP